MKKFFILSVLLMGSNQAHAFMESDLEQLKNAIQVVSASSTSEPIINKQLKLLGRGISGRKSHETLAIACIGETEGSLETNCDLLRFVHFVSASETNFIGPTFKADFKQLKKTMRKMEKRADVRFRQNRSYITLSLSLAATGVFGTLTLVYWPLTVVVVLNMIATLSSRTPWDFFDIVQPIKACLVGNDSVQVVNHDGWNWIEQPRKVREELFVNLVNTITYSTSDNYQQ